MKSLNSFKINVALLGCVAGIISAAGASAWGDFVLGTPANLGAVVNSPQDEYCLNVSRDGLTLLFSDSPFSWRPGGRGKIDMWMATRKTIGEPFAEPANLTSLNSAYHDFSPTLSRDELTLYFASDRPGTRGDLDLWKATRENKSSPFGTPVNLGGTINSNVGDFCPYLSADDLSLYFNSSRWGGHGSCDLYVARRTTVHSAWQTPVNLGGRVNSSNTDGNPVILDDGLTLLFSSSRPGGYGQEDLWVSSRATVSSSWGDPVNLGPAINSSQRETSLSFCGDGAIMLFASAQGGIGGVDLWQLRITPVVDVVTDGIVNLRDFSKLAEHWRRCESSVDMAPAPFGDGKVDHKDLAVFAEYFRLGGRPSQASYPNPPDGGTDVSISTVLSWTAWNDAESHEVHFGKTDPPPLVSTQTGVTYGPLIMSKGTTYYWRIDEVNSWGKTVGQTWSFKTEAGGGR